MNNSVSNKSSQKYHNLFMLFVTKDSNEACKFSSDCISLNEYYIPMSIFDRLEYYRIDAMNFLLVSVLWVGVIVV